MLDDELEDTAKIIGETFHGVQGGNTRVAIRAPDTEQPVATGLKEVLQRMFKKKKIDAKRKIIDAFPKGLQYMIPEPLLSTSGATWEYQPDPSLKGMLRRELTKHYENFISRRFDKRNFPLYLFLSGAGTGKSRNANEFHQTAITCLSAKEDGKLLTRIQGAWVFLISFENGLSLQRESDTYLAIGTRMLFQLLREKMMFREIIEAFEPPDPMDVVSLMAKYYNRNLEDTTVILVIDGMHQLMKDKDDGLMKDTPFYKTLTYIADLAFCGSFLIPVCTSNLTGPIDGMLTYSPRRRVYLPVAYLQPPKYRMHKHSLVSVFHDDKVTNTLVEDCGGHGRALEILNDFLNGRSIEECNIDTLMNDLRHELTLAYHDAIVLSTENIRTIARAILTRCALDRYVPLPNSDKTPDQVVGGGLIRFEQIDNSNMGYLTAPYIWLWIFVELSQKIGDPILRDWEFSDYGEQRALLDPITSMTSRSWQSFEKFVASFRCIKSAVFEENEPVKISEVHAGARLNGDIQFKNHHLQLQVAKHKTNTKSESNIRDIICHNSIVDIKQFKHCIINASSSGYGDAFLSLDQPGTESPNEVHQFKFYKERAVSKDDFQRERKKATSERDFFILFTTSNCNIEIPKMSGVVDKKAFKDYFGPFAGRAYNKFTNFKSNHTASCNKSIIFKSIHTASLGQICVMNQISKERVNAKTKIPMNFYFRKGLNMISRILPRFV